MEHAFFHPTQADKEALDYHARSPHGKTATTLTKPLVSPRDFTLAYSPGVAAPCRMIAHDPATANRYTNRGNLVAVLTNGSALLGLGNLGALPSKPVMEGKCMLLKKLADVDSFDIELDESDPDRLVELIRALSTGFGAILLEDIKAPDCFYIERRLKALLSIPVLHDDQHGTAVVVAAAVINAAKVAGKAIDSLHTVIIGAGAAAIASAKILLRLGIRADRLVMVDSLGVITHERPLLPDYKQHFATTRRISTLKEALVDADLVVGASKGNLMDEEMVRTMAMRPIVLALSNPDPELSPEVAQRARPDLIYATGRSDLKNQANNALAMPYLFRAALDCEARAFNDEMLLAAAHALAALAREEIATEGTTLGAEMLLPKIDDPRLRERIVPAVIEAAIKSGEARVKRKEERGKRKE
ncbi:MAG: malate dehydrogenase, partial [Alistipes sp.]|nr:malate dehydrogenase [Alistipes sp.]